MGRGRWNVFNQEFFLFIMWKFLKLNFNSFVTLVVLKIHSITFSEISRITTKVLRRVLRKILLENVFMKVLYKIFQIYRRVNATLLMIHVHFNYQIYIDVRFTPNSPNIYFVRYKLVVTHLLSRPSASIIYLFMRAASDGKTLNKIATTRLHGNARRQRFNHIWLKFLNQKVALFRCAALHWRKKVIELIESGLHTEMIWGLQWRHESLPFGKVEQCNYHRRRRLQGWFLRQLELLSHH